MQVVWYYTLELQVIIAYANLDLQGKKTYPVAYCTYNRHWSNFWTKNLKVNLYARLTCTPQFMVTPKQSLVNKNNNYFLNGIIKVYFS